MKIIKFEEVADGVFTGRAISGRGREYGFAACWKSLSVWVVDSPRQKVLPPPGLRLALSFQSPKLRA